MDSTDDNAVTNEPEVRRTRSGRAVRPPPTPVSKQSARKTRKKMVLVEVEVSEEEEDNHEHRTSHDDSELNESNNDESLNKSSQENDVPQDEVQEETEETDATSNHHMEIPTVEDSNSEMQNDLNNDSSMDQNDSRSVQFGSTNDSEQLFTEQNSIQDQELSSEQVMAENQDSMQTGTEENSVNDLINDKENSTEKFDASVLNNDSQTQHKPDDNNEGEADLADGSDECPRFTLRSQSYLFGSSHTGNENSESCEPMETDEVNAEEPQKFLNSDSVWSTSETNDENTEIKEETAEIKEESVEEAKDECAAEVSEETAADVKTEEEDANEVEKTKKQAIDPDTENISEDELPTMQAAKVPETEEVSDEELPGPKLAELPADTEVVSEDELPSVKKEGTKRKLEENEYDPGSPTSENEQSAAKKPALDASAEKKDDKQAKPRKLPELDKYWKAVNDDPTDFTGWTYLLQYVDQENDMEAAREAYDAFLSHYPYCYGYWRKYADYEKRKGNKKKCEEVFERGLKAIPLSVDLWLHYLNYARTTHPDDEEHVRSQYERALTSCGLEFRSDRLWEGYIKWETEAKRYVHVTMLYDRLLATPTQGYTNHFDNFQEHVAAHPPNKILEVDEFLALRKEIKHALKKDTTPADPTDSDAPPGENDTQDTTSDEETTAIRERIVSIRRKIHKNTVNAVTARWNYEEGIKRPYFHVKPLERCQLKNWKEYLDFEVEQGDQDRIVVLFERCLIACALYEEFWLRFVHYLESLNNPELKQKIRDVYERACTIHHLNKPSLHLQWAMFEECCENYTRAAEILVNLEKSVPNLLQVAYRRINLERRRGDHEKCSQLYEHYINNSKNKMISSNLAIKYARFCLKICKSTEKAFEILTKAIEKDNSNPRLYLQLIDLQLQKDGVSEKEVLDFIDQFLNRESAEVEQKVLFAQRKLEFLEDFGSDIQSVQKAYDDYQKYCKLNKEKKKKDDSKNADSKKAKDPPLPPTQSSSYSNYSYGTPTTTNTTASTYSQYSSTPSTAQYGNQYGAQYSQNDQYQYQNWQYSQSGYGYNNQWGSYGNYY